jgi:ribosomal protein S13
VGKRLKSGSISLSEVLASGQTDEIIGGMRVSAVVKSLPGVGEVRTRQIMEQIGIPESRRVRGLGARQREALARRSEDRDATARAHEAAAGAHPGAVGVAHVEIEWEIVITQQEVAPEAFAAPEEGLSPGGDSALNLEDWDRPQHRS